MVQRRQGDHPRSRGVYASLTPATGRPPGSSPLARGLRHHSPRPGAIPGIIPARAGFTDPGTVFRLRRPDHPRSRGVYAPHPLPGRLGRGSSPLARGLPPADPAPRPARRIIPARAGFTGPPSGTPRWRSDHPRSRGVYSGSRRRSRPGVGSSPLARGLPSNGTEEWRHRRIIPARAGFTLGQLRHRVHEEDHPRSRGVYASANLS